MPVSLTPSMHELFVQVKSDLISAEKTCGEYGITTEKLNKIKPYSIFGFDTYRLGWLQSSYGSILGIPQYFGQGDRDDVNVTGIQVRKHCWKRLLLTTQHHENLIGVANRAY